MTTSKHFSYKQLSMDSSYKQAGAQVKWWTVTETKNNAQINTEHKLSQDSDLSALVTLKTKVSSISHTSNWLCLMHPIHLLACAMKTKNRAVAVSLIPLCLI